MTLTDRDKERLRDKWWRMNHLYKIQNKNGEIVTFKFNDEQLILFDKYQSKTGGVREQILKGRQIGITTFHTIYYLDEVIWNKGKTAAIIAHEREALEKIFRKAKLAWELMPEPFRPSAKMENKRELFFDGINSNIFIALKVRSGTVHYLHVSEIAYIKDNKELKAGSFATVPMNGYITCETTANGMNHFYIDWKNSLESKTWGNNFFKWQDHRSYVSDIVSERTDHNDYLEGLNQQQKNWWYFKLEEQGNDFDLMRQEYPLSEDDAFRRSNKSIFANMYEDYPVSELIHEENYAFIYKDPVEGADYVMGADTALGHEDGDYSCFFIMDSKTYEVAMKFKAKMDPDSFGKQIIYWGEKYNYAFVGIEENNGGIAVINKVKDDYPELYQREKRDTISNELVRKYGWFTSSKTKDELIAQIMKVLKDKDIPALPQSLMNEFDVFVQHESSSPTRIGARGAESGFNDDEVMAFGITLMMILYNPHFETTTTYGKFMGRDSVYNRRR